MAIVRRQIMPFRRALGRAAWRGWKEGHISGTEYYLLRDIVVGSRAGGRFQKSPVLSRLQERCRQELLVHDPESALTNDIDWAHWIDLIVTWLPILLKLALIILKFDTPPADEPSESSSLSPIFSESRE